MAVLIFGNNAKTTLASPINASATSVTLVDVTGFPVPSSGQYAVMSFFDAATGLITEILHVTALVGNTATIVRAQEGTSAVSWNAGDDALNAWTAGQAAAMQQTAQAQGQQANSAADSGTVNAYVAALSPVPTNHVPGMPIRLLGIRYTNTGASTLNVGLGALPIKASNQSALIGGELIAGADAEFLDCTTYYQLSIVSATTTRPGIVPFATNAQAATGTNGASAMTPASSASVTNLLAPISSPTLTGNPRSTTPATNDDDTSIATTAYVQNNLALYATLVSPEFTGSPTSSTPSTSINSSRIATTAYVQNNLALYATLESPLLTGNPRSTTAATNDDSASIATTAYVQNNLDSYAPIESPALIGSPTAPTQVTGNNSTRLATTAFVQNTVGDIPNAAIGVVGLADYATHNQTIDGSSDSVAVTPGGLGATLASYATLESPLLTGNPRSTTAATNDDSASIATTAYVQNNLASYATLESPLLTGNPRSTTAATNDDSASIATTAYVQNNLASYATLESPLLTGNPRSTTPAANDDDTSIATTAFVNNVINATIWESGQISIPSSPGGEIGIGNAGFTPLLVQAFYVCTAAGGANGYNLGDMYSLEGYTDSNHAIGAVVSIRGPNIFVVFGNSNIFIKDRSTGNFEALSNANWKIEAVAWGLP